MLVLFKNSNHGHTEVTIINNAQRTDCRPRLCSISPLTLARTSSRRLHRPRIDVTYVIATSASPNITDDISAKIPYVQQPSTTTYNTQSQSARHRIQLHDTGTGVCKVLTTTGWECGDYVRVIVLVRDDGPSKSVRQYPRVHNKNVESNAGLLEQS